MSILDTFQSVYLVNLRRRPDRLNAALDALRTAGWPFKDPTIFSAIDCQKVPVPWGWKSGDGAWGCRQSHVAILQHCINEGLEPVLILEDDIVLRSNFVEKVTKFLEEVPDDWECLMLGGQHHATPKKVKSGIVKVTSAQRTHAYAVRGKFLRDLYSRWVSKDQVHHIDWTFCTIQAIYNTYAPDPFLFAQAESYSDICGRTNSQTFWEPPKGDEPLLLLKCDRETVEGLRQFCVHTGKHLNEEGIDVRLADLMQEENPKKLLSEYIRDLQWDAVNRDGAIAAVWHPWITIPMLTAAWVGPVRTIRTVDDFLQFLNGRHQPLFFNLQRPLGGEPMIFAHDGGIGDIIAAMSLIRDLGGGDLVLYPSKAHHTVMTEQLAESIHGIVKQSYIHSVNYCTSLPENSWNMGHWRSHYSGGLNLTDIYYSWVGKDHPDRYRPWLTIDPKPEAEVVFTRSSRYHGNFPWSRAVRKYRDHCLFLGLPEEHKEFVRQFGEVPYRQTNTLTEASHIVAGAKLVISNQTAVYWIAEGLKKPVCLEVCANEGTRNCHWQRIAFYYGTDQYCELPDLDVLDELNQELAAKVKTVDQSGI